MACKECKENEELKKQIFEATKPDDKTLVKLLIIGTFITLYGVVAIIRDIISLFL